MVVGDVIFNKDKHHVITQITNGQVTGTEILEEYISRNIILEYCGEFKSIKDIIDIWCCDYLRTRSLIKNRSEIT